MRCVVVAVAVAGLAAAVGALALPSWRDHDTSYPHRCVLQHNMHRANHSAAAVTWSADLARWAETLARQCDFRHDVSIGIDSSASHHATAGYGQNIAAGVHADNVTMIINDLWYGSEMGWFEGEYGKADPDMASFHRWGHFSQIVWRGTSQIGCSTVACDGPIANVAADVPPYMTVCNYSPPGNYRHEFARNVWKPRDRPSTTWATGLS